VYIEDSIEMGFKGIRNEDMEGKGLAQYRNGYWVL